MAHWLRLLRTRNQCDTKLKLTEWLFIIIPIFVFGRHAPFHHSRFIHTTSISIGWNSKNTFLLTHSVRSLFPFEREKKIWDLRLCSACGNISIVFPLSIYYFCDGSSSIGRDWCESCNLSFLFFFFVWLCHLDVSKIQDSLNVIKWNAVEMLQQLDEPTIITITTTNTHSHMKRSLNSKRR